MNSGSFDLRINRIASETTSNFLRPVPYHRFITSNPISMICSRSAFALGLLALLTCCKPSEPPKAPEPEGPTEKEIRIKIPALSGAKVLQFKRGTIYQSDGRQGPEGNLVFPIRVDFERYEYNYQMQKNTWQLSQVEVDFYRNHFGEWLVDY